METPQESSPWKLMYQRWQQEKYLLLPGLCAILNGYWHKLKFKLLLKDVTIGKVFRVYGRMMIRGPGAVRIGDNCYVDGLTNGHVCLSASVPGAEIRVGDNCGFNGTVIQCFKQVSIGDWSNIADAYITDTPAHATGKNRRQLSASQTPAFPVRIGRNVWVSTRVVILHGVTIGENCVIAACTLVRKDVPPDVMVAGNPQKVVKVLIDE
ncbi:acyltransferase [Thermodesulfobacteriota bacterium]